MNHSNVGIVVPTMSTRPEFLFHALASIRSAGNAIIHIVVPSSVQLVSVLDRNSDDAIVVDPGTCPGPRLLVHFLCG
jgi:hypothetical protein